MHSRGSSASIPNLLRAVAECTQPYGPPPSVSAVRSLQTYLADGSCVDSVYRAILSRACAEPQSEAVIAKCIALIRQYVSRHPPSAAVLAAIATACQDLSAAFAPSSGLQKSLLYLESSVTRTADSTQGNKRLAKISAKSAGSNASSKSAWLLAAANGDVAGSSSSNRAAAAAAAGGSSVHSSTSEDVVGGLQARAAAPSLWGSAEQQQQQQQQQQYGLLQQQQSGQGWPAQGPAGLQPEPEGVRAVPTEAVLPDWTFQPSALQELWAPGADALDEECDLDWSALAPQLSPSLVPLVEGLPGMDVLSMLRCQHVVDAITGADVSIQLRQMREIAEVRRLQCGVTPELLHQALQQSLANRGRRLFQPLPYTQQEQADVLASDVAAVVEIMCGKSSPAAPSAITGAVGLDDPDTYWQQQCLGAEGATQQQQPLLLLYQQTSNLGGPQQQQQQRHVESMGQISSCILVKMVVDLWLSVGGAAAFPLVLRMLQQALYQLQPQYRARAFDIIYNLALHGSMLLPSVTSPPPSPQMQAGRQRPPAPLSTVLSTGLQEQQVDGQHISGLMDTSPGQQLLQASPGSGYSQDDSSSIPSPPQSPSSLAAQQQQSQLQQISPLSLSAAAAGAGGPAGFSSSSPQPSPRGRSRLSRSDLSWMAPDKVAQQQQQQQGQGQLGPSSSSSSFPAVTPGAEAGVAGRAAGGMAAVQEGSGSEAGDGNAAAVPVEAAWEAWLHQLLFELLLMLSMMDEPCEAVWQSALGCLLHLTTHAGHWVAASLSQLPPAAAAALLDACVTFHWSLELHARLVQMAVNLLYLTEQATGHAQGSEPSSSGAEQQQHVLQEQQAEQQQQQRHGVQGSDTKLKPADAYAGPLTSPEDVSVTLDTAAGSRGSRQPPVGKSPHGYGTAGHPASEDGAGFDAPVQQHSSGGARSHFGDLDLPWQLHAGPVDMQQLAAFGGPAKLLQHFCHAGSVEAQRTLLVPLLQVLMPQDAPDTAQLAVLQALCAQPSCLAALQAAVSAGLPGWSSYVLTAVQQQLGAEGLDVPLLSSLLLQLECLSMQRMAVPCPAAAASSTAAEGSSSSSSSRGSDGRHQQQQQQHGQQHGQQQQASLQLPAEVQLALQVTLQQLWGELPAQPTPQPRLPGAGSNSFQVPAEVQGSWKALRALCWCDDELARLASRHWLQQLLAVTLQQSLKGSILLPLPGVQQCMPAPADDAAAGSIASVAAACEAWSEVLQQLVVHCPQGTELLVDALQLHMAACKLQMHCSQTAQQQQQLERERAAAVRECVQAWAFVCQWVLQARVSQSQAALTRLAAMAHSMSCVLALPEWQAPAGATAAAAAAADQPDHVTATKSDSSHMQQPQQQQPPAAAAVDASSESLSLTGMDSSRDFEAGFKGVPPPEPSSEPSGLTKLWGGTGAGPTAWPDNSQNPPGAAVAANSAAATALAAAEGVCWPQAFLLGCAVLIQQLAQVLSGASLALLLVRLLQCKAPSRAADRGFHGRPSSSSAVGAAGAGGFRGSAEGLGVMPCPVLYPWSDGRQDLQLGLGLMLISSCSGDAESFADFGLEAVTQQVLTGCTDPRACLLVSQFMLEHLMQHQQDRYWTALRQLVISAQQANDERLLGNPFLQLVTLLSDQQKSGKSVQGLQL